MVTFKFWAFWCIICLCSLIRSYLPPKKYWREAMAVMWHHRLTFLVSIFLASMYKILPMLLWNGFHPIVSRPNLKATAPSSISSIKILMERSSRKRKKKDGFYRFCLVNCPENFALSCTLHCSALLHSFCESKYVLMH